MIPHEDTVYIVSGYMRTGTSMMMKALEAGGMEVVARASRDDMRKRYADDQYDPNEGGLYELEMKDYRANDFPEPYKGKLIKVLNAGTAALSVMPKIRVVYMRRDYEEVRQSYMGFFDNQLGTTREAFEALMDRSIAILRNRKDTDIDVLWYPEVIADPHAAFSQLKASGWPIDVEKCVEIVKPECYRFRKENLTEGII